MSALMATKANLSGANFSGGVSAPSFLASQNYETNSAAVVLATGAAGIVYLRPNGSGSGTGQFTINNAGTVQANGEINATGGFNVGSSLLLKDLEDVPNCGRGLTQVRSWRTARGKYKSWYNGDGRTRLFHIAENIKIGAPEVVGEVVAKNEKGRDRVFLSLDGDQIAVVHTQAIQELAEQLDLVREELRKLKEGA